MFLYSRVKRDNKLNSRCDFGQLLHQFRLVKVHIISDKNVWVTNLKLSKSCPKSQRKIILLPHFKRKCYFDKLWGNFICKYIISNASIIMFLIVQDRNVRCSYLKSIFLHPSQWLYQEEFCHTIPVSFLHLL